VSAVHESSAIAPVALPEPSATPREPHGDD
jgi:hypothetical protein